MGPEFIMIANSERGIYTYINVNYIRYFEYSRDDDTTEIYLVSGYPEKSFVFEGNFTERILEQIKQLKKEE